MLVAISVIEPKAMKGKDNNMDRKRIMEEAIHSGEMEGAYVSTEFRRDAKAYVEGDFSIEELMTRTKRRWSEKPREPEAAHA